jgi:hypothetical protein
VKSIPAYCWNDQHFPWLIWQFISAKSLWTVDRHFRDFVSRLSNSIGRKTWLLHSGPAYTTHFGPTSSRLNVLQTGSSHATNERSCSPVSSILYNSATCTLVHNYRIGYSAYACGAPPLHLNFNLRIYHSCNFYHIPHTQIILVSFSSNLPRGMEQCSF